MTNTHLSCLFYLKLAHIFSTTRHEPVINIQKKITKVVVEVVLDVTK